MATRVQGAKGSGTGTSAAPSPALGASPTAGNLLFAVVGWNDNTTTVSTPSGWTAGTAISSAVGSSRGGKEFWKISDGTEGTAPAFTLSASENWVIAIEEWSGIDATTPNIGENGQTTTSGTSHSAPSITPTSGKDGIALLGLYYRGASGWSSESVTGTGAGSTTEQQDVSGTDNSLSISSCSIAGTSGIYNGSGTSGNSDNGLCWLAIFQDSVLVAHPRKLLGVGL